MTPRWNYYRCDTCRTYYVTVDVEAGTTPAMIRCWDRPTPVQRRRERHAGCERSMMQSARYPNPRYWPATVPRVADGEWYRPGVYERAKLKKHSPLLYDHVRRGGLLLRHATQLHAFPAPAVRGPEPDLLIIDEITDLPAHLFTQQPTEVPDARDQG